MIQNNRLLKSVSILLCFFMLAEHIAPVAQAQESSHLHSPSSPLDQAPPPSTSFFKIDPRFGVIEEEYRGKVPHKIIFIQDAHDSLEAQMNIARMVSLFTKQGAETVFEEGYAGAVPTDEYFGSIESASSKKKVAYHYLNNLEIGGAEYAHINRPQARGSSAKWELIGADNLNDYLENLRAYREAQAKKNSVQRDLALIQREFEVLAKEKFSSQAKAWLNEKRRFENGEIPFLDYLKRLEFRNPSPESLALYPALWGLSQAARGTDTHIPLSFSAAQIFNELKAFEKEAVEHLFKTEKEKTIWQSLATLGALNKLNNLKLSREEHGFLKQQLSEFKVEGLAKFVARERHKPIVFSKRWKKEIQPALQFYELAEKREIAVEQAIVNWSKEQGGITVLVFGGYHKEGLKEIFKKQGFSYVIVTPRISEVSEKHQKLYQEKMVNVPKLSTPASGSEPRAPSPASHAARQPGLFIRALTDPFVRSEVHDLAAQALKARSLNEFSLRVKPSVEAETDTLSPAKTMSSSAARSELRKSTKKQVNGRPLYTALKKTMFFMILGMVGGATVFFQEAFGDTVGAHLKALGQGQLSISLPWQGDYYVQSAFQLTGPANTWQNIGQLNALGPTNILWTDFAAGEATSKFYRTEFQLLALPEGWARIDSNPNFATKINQTSAVHPSGQIFITKNYLLKNLITGTESSLLTWVYEASYSGYAVNSFVDPAAKIVIYSKVGDRGFGLEREIYVRSLTSPTLSTNIPDAYVQTVDFSENLATITTGDGIVKKINPNTLEITLSAEEISYLAARSDSASMKRFIWQYILKRNHIESSQGWAAGVAPYYSLPINGARPYAQFVREFSTSKLQQLVTEGALQFYDAAQHYLMAQADSDAMKFFIAEYLGYRGYDVSNQGWLNGIAPYYSAPDYAGRSFEQEFVPEMEQVISDGFFVTPRSEMRGKNEKIKSLFKNIFNKEWRIGRGREFFKNLLTDAVRLEVINPKAAEEFKKQLEQNGLSRELTDYMDILGAHAGWAVFSKFNPIGAGSFALVLAGNFWAIPWMFLNGTIRALFVLKVSGFRYPFVLVLSLIPFVGNLAIPLQLRRTHADLGRILVKTLILKAGEKAFKKKSLQPARLPLLLGTAFGGFVAALAFSFFSTDDPFDLVRNVSIAGGVGVLAGAMIDRMDKKSPPRSEMRQPLSPQNPAQLFVRGVFAEGRSAEISGQINSIFSSRKDLVGEILFSRVDFWGGSWSEPAAVERLVLSSPQKNTDKTYIYRFTTNLPSLTPGKYEMIVRVAPKGTEQWTYSGDYGSNLVLDLSQPASFWKVRRILNGEEQNSYEIESAVQSFIHHYSPDEVIKNIREKFPEEAALKEEDLTREISIERVAQSLYKRVFKLAIHKKQGAPILLAFKRIIPEQREHVRGTTEVSDSELLDGTGVSQFLMKADHAEEFSYLERFIQGPASFSLHRDGQLDLAKRKAIVKMLFKVARAMGGKVPRDFGTRSNIIFKEGSDEAVLIDVGDQRLVVLGHDANVDDRNLFLAGIAARYGYTETDPDHNNTFIFDEVLEVLGEDAGLKMLRAADFKIRSYPLEELVKRMREMAGHDIFWEIFYEAHDRGTDFFKMFAAQLHDYLEDYNAPLRGSGVTSRRALKEQLHFILSQKKKAPIVSIDMDDTFLAYGAPITEEALTTFVHFLEKGGHIAFNTLANKEWFYRRVVGALYERLHILGKADLLSQVHIIVDFGREVYVYDQAGGAYRQIYKADSSDKGQGLLKLSEHLKRKASLLAFYGDNFYDAWNDRATLGKPWIPIVINVGREVKDIPSSPKQQYFVSKQKGPTATFQDFVWLTRLLGYTEFSPAQAAAPARSKKKIIRVHAPEKVLHEAPGFVWAGRRGADGNWDAEKVYWIPLFALPNGEYEAQLPRDSNVYSVFWTAGQGVFEGKSAGYWSGEDYEISEKPSRKRSEMRNLGGKISEDIFVGHGYAPRVSRDIFSALFIAFLVGVVQFNINRYQAPRKAVEEWLFQHEKGSVIIQKTKAAKLWTRELFIFWAIKTPDDENHDMVLVTNTKGDVLSKQVIEEFAIERPLRSQSQEVTVFCKRKDSDGYDRRFTVHLQFPADEFLKRTGSRSEARESENVEENDDALYLKSLPTASIWQDQTADARFNLSSRGEAEVPMEQENRVLIGDDTQIQVIGFYNEAHGEAFREQPPFVSLRFRAPSEFSIFRGSFYKKIKGGIRPRSSSETPTSSLVLTLTKGSEVVIGTSDDLNRGDNSKIIRVMVDQIDFKNRRTVLKIKPASKMEVSMLSPSWKRSEIRREEKGGLLRAIKENGLAKGTILVFDAALLGTAIGVVFLAAFSAAGFEFFRLITHRDKITGDEADAMRHWRGPDFWEGKKDKAKLGEGEFGPIYRSESRQKKLRQEIFSGKWKTTEDISSEAMALLRRLYPTEALTQYQRQDSSYSGKVEEVPIILSTEAANSLGLRVTAIPKEVVIEGPEKSMVAVQLKKHTLRIMVGNFVYFPELNQEPYSQMERGRRFAYWLENYVEPFALALGINFLDIKQVGLTDDFLTKLGFSKVHPNSVIWIKDILESRTQKDIAALEKTGFKVPNILVGNRVMIQNLVLAVQIKNRLAEERAESADDPLVAKKTETTLANIARASGGKLSKKQLSDLARTVGWDYMNEQGFEDAYGAADSRLENVKKALAWLYENKTNPAEMITVRLIAETLTKLNLETISAVALAGWFQRNRDVPEVKVVYGPISAAEDFVLKAKRLLEEKKSPDALRKAFEMTPIAWGQWKARSGFVPERLPIADFSKLKPYESFVWHPEYGAGLVVAISEGAPWLEGFSNFAKLEHSIAHYKITLRVVDQNAPKGYKHIYVDTANLQNQGKQLYQATQKEIENFPKNFSQRSEMREEKAEKTGRQAIKQLGLREGSLVQYIGAGRPVWEGIYDQEGEIPWAQIVAETGALVEIYEPQSRHYRAWQEVAKIGGALGRKLKIPPPEQARYESIRAGELRGHENYVDAVLLMSVLSDSWLGFDENSPLDGDSIKVTAHMTREHILLKAMDALKSGGYLILGYYHFEDYEKGIRTIKDEDNQSSAPIYVMSPEEITVAREADARKTEEYLTLLKKKGYSLEKIVSGKDAAHIWTIYQVDKSARSEMRGDEEVPGTLHYKLEDKGRFSFPGSKVKINLGAYYGGKSVTLAPYYPGDPKQRYEAKIDGETIGLILRQQTRFIPYFVLRHPDIKGRFSFKMKNYRTARFSLGEEQGGGEIRLVPREESWDKGFGVLREGEPIAFYDAENDEFHVLETAYYPEEALRSEMRNGDREFARQYQNEAIADLVEGQKRYKLPQRQWAKRATLFLGGATTFSFFYLKSQFASIGFLSLSLIGLVVWAGLHFAQRTRISKSDSLDAAFLMIPGDHPAYENLKSLEMWMKARGIREIPLSALQQWQKFIRNAASLYKLAPEGAAPFFEEAPGLHSRVEKIETIKNLLEKSTRPYGKKEFVRILNLSVFLWERREEEKQRKYHSSNKRDFSRTLIPLDGYVGGLYNIHGDLNSDDVDHQHAIWFLQKHMGQGYVDAYQIGQGIRERLRQEIQTYLSQTFLGGPRSEVRNLRREYQDLKARALKQLVQIYPSGDDRVPSLGEQIAVKTGNPLTSLFDSQASVFLQLLINGNELREAIDTTSKLLKGAERINVPGKEKIKTLLDLLNQMENLRNHAEQGLFVDDQTARSKDYNPAVSFAKAVQALDASSDNGHMVALTIINMLNEVYENNYQDLVERQVPHDLEIVARVAAATEGTLPLEKSFETIRPLFAVKEGQLAYPKFLTFLLHAQVNVTSPGLILENGRLKTTEAFSHSEVRQPEHSDKKIQKFFLSDQAPVGQEKEMVKQMRELNAEIRRRQQIPWEFRYDQWVEQALSGSKDFRYVLAQDAETQKIIGYALFKEVDGVAVFVQLLAAHPDQSRSGIGTQLMTFVFNWARHRGINEVYVETLEANQQAMTFYEKLPERVAGVSVRKWWLGSEGLSFTYRPPSYRFIYALLPQSRSETRGQNLWEEIDPSTIEHHAQFARLGNFYYVEQKPQDTARDPSSQELASIGIPANAIKEGRVIAAPGILVQDDHGREMHFVYPGDTVVALALLEKALALPSTKPFVVFDLGAGTGIISHRALREKNVKKAFLIENDRRLFQITEAIFKMKKLAPQKAQISYASVDAFLKQEFPKILRQELKSARPIFIANVSSADMPNVHLGLLELFRQTPEILLHDPIIILAGLGHKWKGGEQMNNADTKQEEVTKEIFGELARLLSPNFTIQGEVYRTPLHQSELGGKMASHLGALYTLQNSRASNPESRSEMRGGLGKINQVLAEMEVPGPAEPDDIVFNRIAQKISGFNGRSVVFLGGPSAAGKSYLTRNLRNRLEPRKLVELSLDRYFKSRTEMVTDGEQILFDHPGSSHLKLAAEHIRALLRGEKVSIPYFDMNTGIFELQPKEEKKIQTLQLQPGEILVVDSIHALHPDILAAAENTERLKVYVKAPGLVRLARRMARDTERGYTNFDTLKFWPYLMDLERQFIVPTETSADEVFENYHQDQKLTSQTYLKEQVERAGAESGKRRQVFLKAAEAALIRIMRDEEPLLKTLKNRGRKRGLPNLTVAINMMDLGAEISQQGVVFYKNNFTKIKEILPLLRKMGVRKVYLYGLAAVSELSREVHTRPNRDKHFLVRGKSTVLVANYEGRRIQYERVRMDDGHGNIFSIGDMGKINPLFSEEPGKAEEELRETIVLGHELGMAVVSDFISWLAPDAIDESNYQQTFYRELSDAQNQEFRALSGETARQNWINRLVEQNPSFFAVRLNEEEQNRVILVKQLCFFGGCSADQAILNPLHPETQKYYIRTLKKLIDIGIDQVRMDLGHLLLKQNVRGYFEEMRSQGVHLETWLVASGVKTRKNENFEAWFSRQEDPWNAIVDNAKAYALRRGRRIRFTTETYNPTERQRLFALGINAGYNDVIFKTYEALARQPQARADWLDEPVWHVLHDRPWAFAYLTNFDQNSLAAIGGPIRAGAMLLTVLSHLGVPAMVDLRDFMLHRGHLLKIVGGTPDPADPHTHPFATQEEARARAGLMGLRRAVETAPWRIVLEDFLEIEPGNGERYIQILDNENRQRFFSLGWINEAGDWVIALLDFKGGEKGEVRVKLPSANNDTRFHPADYEAVDTQGNRLEFAQWNGKSGENPEIVRVRFGERERNAEYKIIKLRRKSTAPKLPSQEMPVLSRENMLSNPFPEGRLRQLEKILKEPQYAPLREDAVFFALLDEDFFVRSYAANILAGQVSNFVYEADPEVFIRHLLHPLVSLDGIRSRIPGMENFDRRQAARNKRYALLWALAHMREKSGVNITKNHALILRKFKERFSETSSLIKAEKIVKILDQEGTEFTLGTETELTLAELVQLVLARAGRIEHELNKGERDRFYWVTESVKRLISNKARSEARNEKIYAKDHNVSWNELGMALALEGLSENELTEKSLSFRYGTALLYGLHVWAKEKNPEEKSDKKLFEYAVRELRLIAEQWERQRRVASDGTPWGNLAESFGLSIAEAQAVFHQLDPTAQIIFEEVWGLYGHVPNPKMENILSRLAARPKALQMTADRVESIVQFAGKKFRQAWVMRQLNMKAFPIRPGTAHRSHPQINWVEPKLLESVFTKLPETLLTQKNLREIGGKGLIAHLQDRYGSFDEAVKRFRRRLERSKIENLPLPEPPGARVTLEKIKQARSEARPLLMSRSKRGPVLNRSEAREQDSETKRLNSQFDQFAANLMKMPHKAFDRRQFVNLVYGQLSYGVSAVLDQVEAGEISLAEGIRRLINPEHDMVKYFINLFESSRRDQVHEFLLETARYFAENRDSEKYDQFNGQWWDLIEALSFQHLYVYSRLRQIESDLPSTWTTSLEEGRDQFSNPMVSFSVYSPAQKTRAIVSIKFTPVLNYEMQLVFENKTDKSRKVVAEDFVDLTRNQIVRKTHKGAFEAILDKYLKLITDQNGLTIHENPYESIVALAPYSLKVIIDNFSLTTQGLVTYLPSMGQRAIRQFDLARKGVTELDSVYVVPIGDGKRVVVRPHPVWDEIGGFIAPDMLTHPLPVVVELKRPKRRVNWPVFSVKRNQFQHWFIRKESFTGAENSMIIFFDQKNQPHLVKIEDVVFLALEDNIQISRSEVRELGPRASANLELIRKIVQKLLTEKKAPTIPNIMAASKKVTGTELTRIQILNPKVGLDWTRLQSVGVVKAHEFDSKGRAKLLIQALKVVQTNGIEKGKFTQDKLVQKIVVEMRRLSDDKEIISADGLEKWLYQQSSRKDAPAIVRKTQAWLAEYRKDPSLESRIVAYLKSLATAALLAVTEQAVYQAVGSSQSAWSHFKRRNPQFDFWKLVLKILKQRKVKETPKALQPEEKSAVQPSKPNIAELQEKVAAVRKKAAKPPKQSAAASVSVKAISPQPIALLQPSAKSNIITVWVNTDGDFQILRKLTDAKTGRAEVIVKREPIADGTKFSLDVDLNQARIAQIETVGDLLLRTFGITSNLYLRREVSPQAPLKDNTVIRLFSPAQRSEARIPFQVPNWNKADFGKNFQAVESAATDILRYVWDDPNGSFENFKIDHSVWREDLDSDLWTLVTHYDHPYRKHEERFAEILSFNQKGQLVYSGHYLAGIENKVLTPHPDRMIGPRVYISNEGWMRRTLLLLLRSRTFLEIHSEVYGGFGGNPEPSSVRQVIEFFQRQPDIQALPYEIDLGAYVYVISLKSNPTRSETRSGKAAKNYKITPTQAVPISTRPATTGDIDSLADIWDTELKPLSGNPPTLDVFKEFLRKKIVNTEKSDFVFVAEQKGQILGYVIASFNIRLKTSTISQIVIRNSAQGRKIGTQLAVNAFEWLKGINGIEKIVALDWSSEGQSGRIFEKLGFFKEEGSNRFIYNLRQENPSETGMNTGMGDGLVLDVSRAETRTSGKILISRAELATMPEESFEALVKMTAMRPDTKLFVYGEAANENTATLEAREQNLKFQNVRFVHEIPALNDKDQVVFLTDQALPSAAQGKFKKAFASTRTQTDIAAGFWYAEGGDSAYVFRDDKGRLVAAASAASFFAAILSELVFAASA